MLAPVTATSQRPIPAPTTTLCHESPTTTTCDDDKIQFVPEAPPAPAPRAPQPVPSIVPESPEKMECNDDNIHFVSPIPVPRASQSVPQTRTCLRVDCDEDVYANDSTVDELREESHQRARQETLKSAECISNFNNQRRKKATDQQFDYSYTSENCH